MRPRWEVLVGASTLAFALHFAPSAFAGPDPAKLKSASDSFAAGAQAYKARAFEEAAGHFEAADAAVPSAKSLRLAIRSRDEAGQGARAATLAAYALELYSSDSETRTFAQEVITKYGSKLHRAEVSCAAPCLLAVGSRIVHGPAATRWTIYLDPGKSTVGASLLGKIAAKDQSVDARAGGSSSLRFEPPKETAPAAAGVAGPAPAGPASAGPATEAAPRGKPPAREPASGKPAPSDDRAPTSAAPSTETSPTSGLSPWFVYAGAGLTAALGGITIWSGVDTQSAPGVDAVRASCAGQGEDCPLYAEGQSKELRTNALLGATAGAAAVTVVFAILADWSGGNKKKSASSAALAQPSGAFVAPWFGATDAPSSSAVPSSIVVGARGAF
jgi:hypothetical protein